MATAVMDDAIFILDGSRLLLGYFTLAQGNAPLGDGDLEALLELIRAHTMSRGDVFEETQLQGTAEGTLAAASDTWQWSSS